MAELRTRIILRNDSSANWLTNEDVVLLKGEVGIEFLTDGKVKMKVGDGTKTWAQLSYFGGEESHVYEVTLAEGQSHESAIAAEVGENDLAKGDIAIVKALISADKYEYTAYVYNGTAWAAMDGNYSAENVFFNEDFTLAGTYTSIGNIKLSEGTLRAAGLSVKDLMTKILTQELNPTIGTPDFKIEAAGSTTKEVGDTYSMPTATATVTSTGSYSYGSATKDAEGNLTDVDAADTSTGVTYAITVTNDKTSDTKSGEGLVNSSTVKLTTSSDNFTEANSGLSDLIVKDSSIKYTFTASATYTGATRYPLTNLKNEYLADDGSTKEIKADTTADTKTASATISGFRNYWYGFINDSDYTKISRDADTNVVTDGAGVALKAGDKAIANGTFQVKSATQSAGTLESNASVLTSVEGDNAFVIIVPSAADKTVTAATLPLSLNAGIDFIKHSKALQIAGLNGYKSGENGAYGENEYYDVLIYSPASMPTGTELAITLDTDTTN